MLGLARLSGPSDAAFRRAESLAHDADATPAAFALTARAILHFMFARWSQGEAALAAAREICAARPPGQLMEVIETTCGLGAHFQGDGERALAHFDALLARRAGARGSDLHAGWADYARPPRPSLALGRPAVEGWARLAAAEDRLKGLGDRQSQHICQGLRARLAWRLGEVDEALAAATLCGRTARAQAPTNYSSTEAYAAPALVGALAQFAPVSASQRKSAGELARLNVGVLRRYAFVFPIARPRLAMVLAAKAGRRPKTALARLDAAAIDADRRGLRFEAALARRIAAELTGAS